VLAIERFTYSGTTEGISINRLSREIMLPPGRISEVVNSAGITADTALRLVRAFQAWYDFRVAKRTIGKEIEQRIHPFAA
jgi:plasmid maintenance system antidote protein VapI